MLHGIVKWFNDKKGYGFISSEGREYFVHFSEIQKDGHKTLYENEKVSFTPENSKRGTVATKVAVI